MGRKVYNKTMKSNSNSIVTKSDIFEPIRAAIALGGEVLALPGSYAYQVSMTDSLSRTDYQHIGFCSDYASARALAVNWIIENRLSILKYWGWNNRGALTIMGVNSQNARPLALQVEDDFTAKINLDPISFSTKNWVNAHSDEEMFNIWQKIAEDQQDEFFIIEKVKIIFEESATKRAEFTLNYS